MRAAVSLPVEEPAALEAPPAQVRGEGAVLEDPLDGVGEAVRVVRVDEAARRRPRPRRGPSRAEQTTGRPAAMASTTGQAEALLERGEHEERRTRPSARGRRRLSR